MVALGTIRSNRCLLQDELGTGGMSTVYRAVDLRTGGTVAVKIPHEFLIRDPQYLQRFTREAQIAATIQSTRIAHVTDVSEHESTPYIVMECVEGESLSERLVRDGALPPQVALGFALDMARAIDAAHARGVVHRDLKPQNVRIMPDGDVKVLDFGIARMEGKAALTTASLFLGTPDYAAPERSEGAGDIRADIYSLGVVLYEMLCGRLPFSGSTPWTVMRMHTAEPPPPLPDDVPPVARAIVDRCLEKSPADRYQTPHELADAIQSALRALDREEIAGTLTASLPPIAQPETHAPEQSGSGSLQPLAPPSNAPPAPPNGAPAIATQPRRPPLVPILAGVTALVVIAILAVALLNRGGDTDTPPEEPEVVTAGPSLTILDPADGANVSGPVAVQLDVTGVNLKAPAEADPAGRHIHYFLDVDLATVLVPGQPIPTGQANIVHTANASHTFLDLPAGPHTVWAVVTGNDHVPLTPNVQGTTAFTVVPDPLAGARTGEKAPVVYQSLVDGKWRIAVKDGLDGEARRLASGNANDFNPALSPDGSRIAFNSDRDGASSIYTMNLDGSDIKRITDGSSNDRSAAYSPDGTMIVFQSDRDGGREHLWAVPVNGGAPRQITRGAQNDTAPNWSRDGSRIVYQSDAGGGVTHIFVVDARGGGPRQLTDGPARDNCPVWSPDGRQIAFARFENNQWNVYATSADGSDIHRLTEGSFNINPSWSPDGKQILFQSDRDNGQQQIFVMPAEGGVARRIKQLTAINASPSWPMK